LFFGFKLPKKTPRLPTDPFPLLPFVEPTDEANKGKRGAIVALDTLTWQMLASVFWPGSFIRCVVNATAVAVAAAHLDASIGADVAKAIPTVAGIAAIPFIVKPIDETVDTAMEMSVTKALNGRIEGVQDAGVALATIGACLAVPPTLFSVASAIKDIAV
jgi:fission process protein 1|tara:strand:+ start:2069 stop:2548 length:480 start_codon:yes stop_codon:yes gene_type:complete